MNAGISLLLALGLFAALAFQQPEGAKRLTVYATQTGYTVTLLEANGQPYVDVGELLQSLGDMRVEDNGNKWKARFNGQEMRFENGKERAKLRKQDLDMLGPFLVHEGRGLVPLASLPLLLNIMLGQRVQMHEGARRIFIGDVVTHYSAELAKPGPGLILNFSSPVNPVITSEPGRVRLHFAREPVVAAAEKLSFDDKTITSATFSESNGSADITIVSTAPLIASFAGGGKSISLAPAPVAAAPPPPEPATPSAAQPAASAPAAPAPAAPAPAPATSARGRYLIVIDPAHGGDERGAALTDKLAEKDVTLAFARRLRTELANRNVAASLLRDADGTLTTDQRADATNTSRAMLYIAIHAASGGTGVRVYSPLLPADNNDPAAAPGMVPWQRAQAPFAESSANWAAALAAALQQKQVPSRAMAAALRPMNSITTAAIAVELSPPAGKTVDPQSLTGAAFQQNMASALAAALVDARRKMDAAGPQAVLRVQRSLAGGRQ
ncbi:MAG TPA: N-acetylmuramoyl-L-alanine amidase [Terriglobales bacterium]|nr:N-acetylmuramoyl-L-alanine amidase [Terriglobales bacterium]